MAFPERLFQGAATIIDGEARRRDGRPFDLTGWRVFLVLLNPRTGERHLVPGGIRDARRGFFQVPIAQAVTAELQPGTWKYELFAQAPDGQEYVFEQGQVDVRPRL